MLALPINAILTEHYEDEIIILTVVDFSDSVGETEQFISDYKETLKIQFEQEEIFITEQDLTIY